MKTMKKKSLLKITQFILLFCIIAPGVYAQQKLQLVDEKVTLKIMGTSNLHDWTMEAEGLNGDMQAWINESSIEAIENGNLRVVVDKIESGKSIMNKKTYDALNSDDHPYITFQLQSVEDLYSAGSNFSGKARGVLTIAGQSENVTIPVTGKIKDNQVIVNGNYSLKMTSFQVDPPTAMFGSLKTGDQVTVEYELIFKPKSSLITETK